MQDLTLTQIAARLRLSTAGLEELFGTGRSHLDASFEDALVRTCANVAAIYRCAGMGSRRERICARIHAILDGRDAEGAVSWSRCSLLPAPGPGVHVSVWELPPGKAGNPYRYPLTAEEVFVVVLEGRAALHTDPALPANGGLQTDGESRDLQKNQAAVVRRSVGGELLNYTDKRVRFLALRSGVG
jgi:hypothetical protein